ncbi:cyclopropane fatty acyl phospholipid synthase [Cobetia sp. D5]|uniref:cyclopropane fatty acyl phospholipid synthase n=1 Tax=unclassified Cobetia TaxID=2609414 RepID=UPI00178CA6D4|nr:MULTISPECIES: cyclopropane fatty acyl phospholipid synthase [unclassified Cobetia]MBE2167234.1 cyclopropane fatty acyl phospholipid synthase [Cobetia sp. 2AS1]MCK8066661.1 cyclopropane fatty acyl phospholipid synthase [Cobetia sp. 1CM21F]MDH2447321.1 cyclopropane fatty acyl phospholipid synthase [Cobetia sp. 2AS]
MSIEQRLAPVALPDTRHRRTVEHLLAGSGVRLNGPDPWDIRVRHPDLFRRVLQQGSLGLGEAYMEGWWDCEQIDEMICRLLRHGLGSRAHTTSERIAYRLQAGVINLQSRRRAGVVGKVHYDFGNDLFTRMLDDTLCYSCGYWKDLPVSAENLGKAQQAKLDLVCRKLGLAPGMRLLDIGCGWGSLAAYAARHYGVEVVGITISAEQAALAREHCAGLPVEILLKDYRDPDFRRTVGSFDAIASIGMFEHVGHKNYATYFAHAAHLLRPGGRFVLHTIGSNQSDISADPWVNRYIFPNGVLPSASQLVRASEAHLVMEDWHNFGADYDPTLMAWRANLDQHWHELADTYSPRDKRMFEYYLGACAGAFRARQLQLWQVVFTHGTAGRYDAPR